MKPASEYKLLYIKRQLFQEKVNTTGIISNGLVHHTPKQKVLQMLQKEVKIAQKRLGLNYSEANRLYFQAIDQYNFVSKKVGSKLRSIDMKFGKKEQYDENLKQRQAVIAHTVQKHYIQNDRLTQERNLVAYDVEQRLKHDEIYSQTTGIIAEARQKDHYSPFFLCSAHPKPAKDHKDWAGKMYFDADYAAHVQDSHELARIASYIRNHHLVSVQWVTGEPIWLGTRKNCKHFFKNIPVDEVLHASAKTLVKRHKLYMAEERPITPAIRAYRAYYDRLKTQLELYKVSPSEELEKGIARTRKLLAKWTAAINNENRAG